LRKRQEGEIKEFYDNAESAFPVEAKPSSERLNLLKVIDNAVKQENWKEAHRAQTRLERLINKEQAAWTELRASRMAKRLATLKTKHARESENLAKRIRKNEVSLQAKCEFAIRRKETIMRSRVLEMKTSNTIDLNRSIRDTKVSGGHSRTMSRSGDRANSLSLSFTMGAGAKGPANRRSLSTALS
jgi:hypothetical protein